jgi:hypothetical protein
MNTPQNAAPGNAPPVKRRRWKRWAAAAVLALLVGYTASCGPAAYGVGRGWLTAATFRATYAPLDRGAAATDTTDFYRGYVGTWHTHGMQAARN